MDINHKDIWYMQRAIQLAYHGQLTTPPNPMVGAVIVHNDKIIGEGYHIRAGEAHAEVHAINSVGNKELLKESTIYVTLEPCSHYGKTPPCAQLIIDMGIPRIVVGCIDPFEKVSGRGIQMLQNAGREVVVGVLQETCYNIIRRFVTFHLHKRPYITLKWAISADGFVDRLRPEVQSGKITPCDMPAARLSSDRSAIFTHKRRTYHQAILVGRDTVKMDYPNLLSRYWDGPQPQRYVMSQSNALEHLSQLPLFQGKHPARILSTHSVSEAMKQLHSDGMQSVLVEGGPTLHQAFIDAGLWDEIIIEQSDTVLGQGILPATISCVTPRFVTKWAQKTWFTLQNPINYYNK